MTIVGALMGFLLLSGAVSAIPHNTGAPTAPVVPNYAVTVTAYNAVPEQTDGDPFTTASGAYSNPEVIAARSRDLGDQLPFGTIIEVSGPTGPDNNCGYGVVAPLVGYRIIADTMNERYTNRIDILFGTEANYVMADGTQKNAGNILGICAGSSVRVVGHLDGTHPGKFPKTQKALAELVKAGNSSLALK